MPMALVVLNAPDSDVAQATTMALLQAHGIPCFARGGGFGALYPGPHVAGFNTTSILVPEEFLVDAKALLSAQPIWDEPDEPGRVP